MKKISKIVLWVLAIISVVMTVLYLYFKGEDGGPSIDKWTTIYLGWAYIMLAISILAVVLLPLLTFKERKFSFKSILVILVGGVILIGGAYLLAPGGSLTLANGTVFEGNVTKWTDTGIIVTYFLLILSVLAILGGSVFNAIKKD